MRKWLSSTRYAISGLALFFRTERNARIELAAAIIVLIAGVWLQLSIIEICIVLLCIGSVLAAEALNSAIERMADFQHPGIHPEIKHIKDIAAGAVLVTAIISFVVGVLIFGPPVMGRMGLI